MLENDVIALVADLGSSFTGNQKNMIWFPTPPEEINQGMIIIFY